MRVAILETVKTTAGFEQEFDRLIFDELKKQGHSPILYLPENSELSCDFGVPIQYLQGGEIVSYEGASFLKKWLLSYEREQRRVRWFNAAYEKACNGEVDAIILTTATYRYLRSLHKSKLKASPVPVIFIFLGVNPQEKPKYLKEARDCAKYPNIHLKITSLRNDFEDETLARLSIIDPPVLVPSSIHVSTALRSQTPIKIGFFGHYRKGEKDIEGIVKAFVKANSQKKAHLIIQAAPTTEEDRVDIERIMSQFSSKNEITFITRKLKGNEWYDALMNIDVLFLPYSNPRYLYNWSAVYFNALGLYKPVLATKLLNPEILQRFHVGAEVDIENLEKLTQELKCFIEEYDEHRLLYETELKRVNVEFGTDRFLKNILSTSRT